MSTMLVMARNLSQDLTPVIRLIRSSSTAHPSVPRTPTMRNTKYAINIHVPGQTVSLRGNASWGMMTGVVNAIAAQTLNIVKYTKYLTSLSRLSEATSFADGGTYLTAYTPTGIPLARRPHGV